MAEYELHVLCSGCGTFHALQTRVGLDADFVVRRVSDVDPDLLRKLHLETVWCEARQETYQIGKPDMIVLVLTGAAD